jgi:cysteine synthase A
VSSIVVASSSSATSDDERRDGVLSLIGNTPLMRIASLSDATGCTILGKLEFMNPGGSTKDRAVLRIVEEAERDGLIRV